MSDAFYSFLETLQVHGLEHVSIRKFYGTYQAKVVRNDDPDGRGRVQVLCPGFANDEPIDIWLDPCGTGGGPNRGPFLPPEVGDFVWIQFDQGDGRRPHLYFLGGHATDQMPKEFKYTGSNTENPAPEKRGFISRGGHRIIWSDEKGNESIRILWHKPSSVDPDVSVSADRSSGEMASLMFEPNGDVIILNKNGTLVHLDAENKEFKIIDENGNVISTSSSGVMVATGDGKASVSLEGGKVNIISSGDVTVNAPTANLKTGGVYLGDMAQLKAVLGEPLLVWLNSHVHLTAFGPSTPPVVPAPPSLLSNSVKVKI